MGFSIKKAFKGAGNTLKSAGKSIGGSLKNPGKTLGDIKSNLQDITMRPVSTLTKPLGMENNDLMPYLDMAAAAAMGNPLPMMDTASSMLGFKEGNDVLGSITGTKDIKGKAMNKAMESFKIGEQKAAKEGGLAVDQFKKFGDSLAGANNIFNPLTIKSTRSGKANAELEQLLNVFEARRSSIANRRAQPGISQTRLG